MAGLRTAIAAGLTVAVGATGASLVACATDADPSASGGPSTSVESRPSRSTPVPGEADGTCPTERAARPYPVGRRHETLVDPSRPTHPVPSRDLPGQPQRTLPVTVLYPSTGVGDAQSAVTEGAPVADGRFPVVVWSHGVISSGDERNDVLADVARAGYVVVAPTFPLSSGPQGLDVSDLPGQAGDVMFVLSEVRDRGAVDWLAGHVLSKCVALAGHSLGGATTLAAAFDPCCRPDGLEAVIDVSGVLVNLTPGVDRADVPATPTLIVHGSLDNTVPATQGQRTFDQLRGPRWSLTFPTGDHNSCSSRRSGRFWFLRW